jgi:hypothetical protein
MKRLGKNAWKLNPEIVSSNKSMAVVIFINWISQETNPWRWWRWWHFNSISFWKQNGK